MRVGETLLGLACLSAAMDMLRGVSQGQQPVTLFTFFLELPHALPMSRERAAVTIDDRDEHWEGWSDDQVAGILTPEPESPFPSGFAPGTRIVVRHVKANDPPPLLAAEEAFAGWVDALFTESDAAERKRQRQDWGDAGIDVIRSVVALSRFLPRSAHPRGEEMTIGWLLSQFRLALSDFNRMLEALGFVLGRWNVGAIALRDLPAEIPVLIGATEKLPDGRPAGITFTARIHDAYPELANNFEPQLGPTEEAARLTNEARNGEQPYMEVFRFVHAAESERLAGDATRAVVNLNTAIEILVSVTLREGGPIAGLSEKDLVDADTAGMKGKVRKYLARMFDEEIEITSTDNAWGRWFADGYQLRNQAVHEGLFLDREAVERAFSQAGEVVAEIKGKLGARESLKPLGTKLSIDLRRLESSGRDELLGVRFPWDSVR